MPTPTSTPPERTRFGSGAASVSERALMRDFAYALLGVPALLESQGHERPHRTDTLQRITAYRAGQRAAQYLATHPAEAISGFLSALQHPDPGGCP